MSLLFTALLIDLDPDEEKKQQIYCGPDFAVEDFDGGLRCRFLNLTEFHLFKFRVVFYFKSNLLRCQCAMEVADNVAS